MIGHVTAVNDDATVTVVVRGEVLPSLPADPAYSPRVVGDRVEVEFRKGLAYVLGKRAGAPAAAPVAPWSHTLVASAPGGSFVEASSVWVNPTTREVRYVRSVPAPPTTTGTLVRAATGIGTYRGGVLIKDNYAEQGSWGGYGPDTGVFTYGAGAWSSLAGKTITGVRVSVHRMNSGGVNGPTRVHMGLHAATALPGTTPSVGTTTPIVALNRNEPATVDLPIPFGNSLRDGAAAGVAIAHPSDNVQLDLATLTVDWSD